MDEFMIDVILAFVVFELGMWAMEGCLSGEEKKGAALKCVGYGIIVAVMAGAFSYLADPLNTFLIQYETGGWMYASYILLCLHYAVEAMIPGIAVFLTSIALSKKKRAERGFIALIVSLVEFILLNVVCEVINIPFLRKGDGRAKEYPVFGIRILIIILCIGGAVLLFRYYYRRRIEQRLAQIEGNVLKFVKLPFISYLIFCGVLSVMDLVHINLRSYNSLNVYMTWILSGGLLVMYIFLYSALFDAIRISGETAKIRADLEVASNIQKSALPEVSGTFQERKEFDIFADMFPAKEVGGDFFDFFMLDEEHLALVIADVAGKGIPAALFMMAGKTTLRNQASVCGDPGTILANANQQLEENNRENLFITAFLAVLNLETGEMTFGNAGHNPPYICRNDGTVEGLKGSGGFVLGGLSGIPYQTERTVLQPGEKILLYTDGVTEAVNMEEDLYGEERLKKVLMLKRNLPVREIVDGIRRDVSEYAEGMQQSDDITMLMVEYRGRAE